MSLQAVYINLHSPDIYSYIQLYILCIYYKFRVLKLVIIVGTEAHIRKKDVVEDEKEKENDAALEDKEKDLEERTRTNSLGEV